MSDELPIVAICRVNEITIEVCSGEIPDIFQQLWFDAISEFELPETKISDEEFEDWLDLYRHANSWFEYHLLEESLCN